MNTATVTWPGPGVVQPAIQRPTAMRLAETEYQRVIDVVNALQFEDWTRPTDCTAWNVRQLVAHIAGNTKILSSPFELARQLRAAKTRQQPGQASIDALTALQVEERQHLGPEELRAELGRAGPRAAKARRRIPGIVRRRRLPDPEVVNSLPETWSIGYACDLHPRPVDAPAGPRPSNRSRPGTHRRPRRCHRRRRCGRVGPPPRPALPTRTHRPRRRKLELRHRRRRDRDGCRRLLPGALWPPRPPRWPTLGATHHPGPILSARRRTMTVTSTGRRGSAEK
jgi:hypothetical protein